MSEVKTTPAEPVAKGYVVKLAIEIKAGTTLQPLLVFEKAPAPSQFIGRLVHELYRTGVTYNKTTLSYRASFPSAFPDKGGKKEVVGIAKNCKKQSACLMGIEADLMLMFSNELKNEDAYEVSNGVNPFQDQIMERRGFKHLIGAPTDNKVNAIGLLQKSVADLHKQLDNQSVGLVDQLRVNMGLLTFDQQKALAKANREATKLLNAPAS